MRDDGQGSAEGVPGEVPAAVVAQLTNDEANRARRISEAWQERCRIMGINVKHSFDVNFLGTSIKCPSDASHLQWYQKLANDIFRPLMEQAVQRFNDALAEEIRK